MGVDRIRGSEERPQIAGCFFYLLTESLVISQVWPSSGTMARVPRHLLQDVKLMPRSYITFDMLQSYYFRPK